MTADAIEYLGAAEGTVRRIFNRMSQIARLVELAAAPSSVTPAERELERLRFQYLPMWFRWHGMGGVSTGYPSQVPLARMMKPTVREFDHSDDEPIDVAACTLIDRAITRMEADLPLPHLRAALSTRYRCQGVAAVFRSGRLTQCEVDYTADRGERLLAPILKAAGLLL